MKFIDSNTLAKSLPWDRLIDSLEMAFQSPPECPPRHHHTINRAAQMDATLLLMPAWEQNGHIGIKLVTVFPSNSEKSLPAISALYVVFDGENGQLRAVLDGGELTARRTAAASALAARYLAPMHARRMLMVGAGRLSTQVVQAHCAVRPIDSIEIWNVNPDNAAKKAEELQRLGLNARPTTDLEAATNHAQIISCATLSHKPLVHGDWISPGTHLDLIGAFKPDMRETDSVVFERADSVFVDTYAGASNEAGDLLCAANEGAFDLNEVKADMFDLCQGSHPGRVSEDEVTVFKSVGASIEDLAAAMCVVTG